MKFFFTEIISVPFQYQYLRNFSYSFCIDICRTHSSAYNHGAVLTCVVKLASELSTLTQVTNYTS